MISPKITVAQLEFLKNNFDWLKINAEESDYVQMCSEVTDLGCLRIFDDGSILIGCLRIFDDGSILIGGEKWFTEDSEFSVNIRRHQEEN